MAKWANEREQDLSLYRLSDTGIVPRSGEFTGRDAIATVAYLIIFIYF